MTAYPEGVEVATFRSAREPGAGAPAMQEGL
jgi:hypothetical protein